MPRKEPLLRTQLLVWLLAPLTVLLAGDTLLSYWMGLRFAQRAYDHALVEVAREVSLHVRDAPEGLQLDMPEAARAVLFADLYDAFFYELATADGKTVAGDAIVPSGAPGTLPVGEEVLYDGVVLDAPVRIVELTVRPGAVVRVAETKVKRNELAREILYSVVVPQLVLILLAGVLVWGGVVRGLKPLERLQEGVAARSHLDRSPVVVAEVPGELHPLMHSINGLLERLDHVLTLQSRFTADAAHQLKTPIAGLQAQLELALRERDPAALREGVEKAHAGLERLTRIVSQLLSLARNEPDAVRTVSLQRTDLNAVALETASAWVPEALRKRIDLGFEGVAQPLCIDGDAGRLRELLDNLIDNAVRYSREGGKVTVRVRAEPTPAVDVSDDGPGIPLHERSRVFERFHRVLGNPQQGSGLGLAIANEIARLHGAEIMLADDADGVGTTFTVSFRPSSS